MAARASEIHGCQEACCSEPETPRPGPLARAADWLVARGWMALLFFAAAVAYTALLISVRS